MLVWALTVYKGDEMAHYFTNDDVKSEPLELEVIFQKEMYKFYSDNGVFSKRNLDYGTRSLLDKLPFDEIKGEVLDFGCGYGPIGIIVAKKTKARVSMIDINKRSLMLAAKNARINAVDVNIYESNIYEKVNNTFDYIITNPPIRVGKKILYEILFQAKNYLKPSGELWLVINKDQGAKSLLSDLEKTYRVTLIDKNKGFYIIKCLLNNNA